MNQLGKKVVAFRIPILILSVLLLIPAVWGYLHTRINYDILSYLPGDIETMQGQDILLEEFGTGAFSLCVVSGMQNREISTLEGELKEVAHVKDVIWYGSIADLSVPMDLLPGDIKETLQNAETGSSLLIVTFDTSMSADETLDAISEIRGLTDRNCLLSGMSAVVLDIKKICNSEALVYVALAALLSALVLALTVDNMLSLFSSCYAFLAAACFVPFVGGALWKGGTTKGAVSSSVVGMLTVVAIWCGLKVPMAGVFPILPAAVTYVAVSLFTKEERPAAA